MTTAAPAAAPAAATADATTADATAAGTPSPADVAAQAAAAAAAQPGTPAAGTEPAAGQVQGVDTTGWPQPAIDALAKAQANAAKYQREAGDQRINAKNTAREEGMRQAALAFAKAAGIEIPGEAAEVTVESVQATLAEQGTTLAESQRQLAATQAAWANQVNPSEQERLEFKLSRSAEYKALDTTDAEFSSKVSAIVAAMVAADPSLKLTGAAAASGVEHLGGASGSTTISQDAFNAMSMTERTNLYRSDKATYQALAANAS